MDEWINTYVVFLQVATHVVNSPGPFEITTTTRPGSLVVLAAIEFKAFNYADGET